MDSSNSKNARLRLKNRGRAPEEGWNFYEEGVPRPLTAKTFGELVKLVMRHRAVNEKPCGTESETAAEVEHQVCERLPASLSYRY